MIEMPNPWSVLDAEHLESTEDLGVELLAAMARGETPTMPEGMLLLLTEKDAADAFTRIRFHEECKAKTLSEAEAMRAPLLAQLAMIDAWAKDRVELRDNRIAFHRDRLAAFYRMNPPTKGKTLSLPFGAISCRVQQPKWDWSKDENLLLATVKAADPSLVKVETVESVNKNDLKKLARVEEGHAYLITKDGEKVELPVTVTPQPEKFEIELPKGA